MFFETLLDFKLNIFAIIMLCIVLFSLISKREVYKVSSKIFIALFIGIISMLTIEIFSWLFDGLSGNINYYANYTFNLIFFIFGPGVVSIFAVYIDYTLFEDTLRLKKRFYYLHIFVFSITLAIINFFTPIVFSINSHNVYKREDFMFLAFTAAFILMLYLLLLTYFNKSLVSKKVLMSIYIFSLLPFAAGILQLMEFGLSIMWSFMALGAVIAYLYTEMVPTNEDYLTKAYTRIVATEYMSHLIRSDSGFTLFWFDLDYFKEFNDTYGHKEGDTVLIHFVNLLNHIYPKDSIITRFGGDEFVVITKETDLLKLSQFKELLYKELLVYSKYPAINEIHFSVGLRIRKPGDQNSIDELLVDADKDMYINKAENKNLKRRKSDI